MRKKGFWVILAVLAALLGLIRNSTIQPGIYYKADLMTAGIEITNKLETREMEYQAIQAARELHEADNPAHEESLQTLTLMTFNIRSAHSGSGTVELDSIIEEIRETNADIIGLQEVDLNMPRSNYQDQGRIIAEQLGYHYFYGENISILGIQYGNVLLSKYPILRAINHRLPRMELEPRGMIEADIDINGTLWHVFVTHLGLNSWERRKQIHYINNIISRREGNITLLGDFNNHSDNVEMSIMDSNLIDSALALNCLDQFTFAWGNDVPNVRIDRIYVSDNIVPLNLKVMPSEISDHGRVVLQILFNKIYKEGI